MVFNSFIFILLFLPLSVAGYFLTNKINPKVGKIFLVVANVLFYLYGGWKFMLVTCTSVLFNLIFAIIISKVKNKKPFYIIGIVLNILFLFLFKYSTPLLSAMSIDFNFFNLLLPLGVSYYTFQQIAFLSSIYRKEVEHFDILDYLVYILFFPKIMMGPLIEYKPFVEQLNDESRKSFNVDNFLKGAKLFCFGLFKKVIFAETFASIVAFGFANYTDLCSWDVMLLMLSYTFQLYFDFSGYTDMAVGVALMMNFEIPHNFNSPYRATSFRDFWKRWHITLTAFLTKYIYIPLGGNRKGKVLTCVNVMIVFLISGIWHGANLTFLLWGAIWGLLCVIDRFIKKPKTTTGKIIGWIVVFSFTNILWLLFRADSIEQWWELMKRLFTPLEKVYVYNYLLDRLGTPLAWPLMYISWVNKTTIAILIIVVSSIICFFVPNNYERRNKISVASLTFAALALITSLFFLSTSTPFLYFGF